MGIQSFAIIFQKYKYRWKILSLSVRIDKLKIRTSNGYDTNNERGIIEKSFIRIVKEIKENGWNPS